ncbi:co-chaperone GroES [Photobacterium sp. WH77]|uniref:co-chaperone GroES n=1 Tax=unclassified Photobacterium TaxID=2628852 RepID=UPI001EDBB567|nr:MULTISPECIES: co-chaperone GroES [unclassified Photobacterium]MCG2837460.1 co-chaperone GroES [Photobacterium sp. WH77]MCG2844970.1 co-chaperone GroES [Photobacterium sp. WH80]
MKLRPLHDWGLVEPEPFRFEDKGFVIPSPPSNQGRVKAIGPLAKGVECGDLIRFNPYGAFEVRVGNKRLNLIRFDMCLV